MITENDRPKEGNERAEDMQHMRPRRKGWKVMLSWQSTCRLEL